MKSKNLFLIFIFGLFLFLLPSGVGAYCNATILGPPAQSGSCSIYFTGPLDLSSEPYIGIISQFAGQYDEGLVAGGLLGFCADSDGWTAQTNKIPAGYPSRKFCTVIHNRAVFPGCIRCVQPGLYDADAGKCVRCDVGTKTETRILGTTGTLYNPCSNPPGIAGDGKCESVCAASPECDEVTYGSNISVPGGGVCNYCVFVPPIPPSYTLSVQSSPVTGISITGSPSTYSGTTNYTKTNISAGTSISLTAPATFGSYDFSSWSDCDSVGGTGNRTCNVTMNASKTVTANYTLSGPSPPPTPGGIQCQAVSSSRIDVSWNSVSGEDGYYIYRCEGSSCTPTTRVRTQTGTSWSNTGLAANTTYRYRVRAYNAGGESGYSSIVTCTTHAEAPPPTPGGIQCQAVSSSRIDVSWNSVSGEDGYYIYRCEGSSCTPTTRVRTQTGTSWSNTGLAANTTYRYRVRAYNAGGESGYSSIVTCTTWEPEPGFDFSISVIPDFGSVAQGGSTSPSTVTVTLNSPPTQSVSFYVVISGLPSGASPSFSPPSCSPSCSSSMVISTSATTTPTGTYPLLVCGTSGTVIHCYTYTLEITEAGTSINPPQVTADGADNITLNSATIRGTLTNKGGAASCLVWFEYKKESDATWVKVCEQNKGSTGSFFCDLTGLTASTTYQFKAFAKNGGSW